MKPLKIGSPVSSHRTLPPSVSDGLLLLMPAVFDEQLGFSDCPLSSRKIPDTCQSLASCLSTGSCVKVGTS